uniref:Exportin-1/Importin-beta-like domain-containing protein n=1 Tax=Globodera rostochiensis TaxID=31243 RepID=A0A914HD50_GLORO
MAITTERVYEALSALQSNETQQNMQASRWLEDFQKSVYAWTVADQMLAEGRSFEACLFAAQTLRTKVLHSARELPSDAVAPLRDSLLNQLGSIESRFGRNTTAIVIQLSAALSDLYIQVVDWKGFVAQILVQLSSSPSSSSSPILLALFKALPEELYSRKLKIGENRRAEVEEEMAAHTETVLNKLFHLCSTDASEENGLRAQAVNCLSSWLLNCRCPAGVLARSPFFRNCTTRPPNKLELSSEQNELAQLLQQSIFETADAFRVAMREEDSEKLQNFARLYAEQSNAFLTEMANQHRKGFGDLRMLDMLQMVSDYHDYSLCEMSFNVWYQLSEYLYRCEEADFEELRCVFVPYVEKHILSVCKHCRVEPDSHELLDRNSEHADFRSKTQESVKDVTFIVGSVNLLKRLMEVLNSSDSWDQMEAILFIISAFVGNVAETERSVVPLLLDAILKFPIMATHRQLLKTSVQMIGNLQNWLEFNWEYTERIFNWLASLFGLGGGILGLTVAECLEQLMERGWQEVQRRNFHNEYLATLNELLARVEQAQSSGQEMEQAAHHLLRASAHLINDLPAHQLCAGLGRLCAGSNARLGEINQKTLGQVHASQIASSSTLFEENKENGPDSWAKLQTDPVLWLDRLAGVWRILLPWQQQLAYKQMANEGQELPPECPWLTLCSNAMECALTTLQRHQSEQRVVEHSCRTIRFLIRSMGAQSVVFIEPLASQIMLTYGQFPHSCLLYLSSILVDEYGAMAHLQPGMLQMLENLATRSLALLAADSENGLRNHPDTVDDLYRLAIRFVQRSPSILFSHPVVVQLLQGAIHGLVLNHQDANKSVTKFVLEIIAVANGKRGQALSKDITARVGQLLAENGPQLMLASVSAALFHLSNSLCKEMAEIVHELLKTDKQKAEQWLNFVCMQLPNDGGHSATPKQLNDFRVTVLESVRPYDILEAMRELSKFYA